MLLVSGIARKHGIVPKPFLGRPQYFPPPKKSIFFKGQEISQEREFGASQTGDYKKLFLTVQTYLEGQSLCSPHLTPQIHCLPGFGFTSLIPYTIIVRTGRAFRFYCALQYAYCGRIYCI
jgi:hypothetical protein